MLRERGEHEEAERLRAGQIADMISSLRTSQDTDASLAVRLDSIFAAEAERVANASALAELLEPLFSKHLEKLRSVAAPPDVSVIAVSDLAATPTPASPPRAKSPEPRPAASIADFIDEMIAQEKPPGGSRRGAQRRAS